MTTRTLTEHDWTPDEQKALQTAASRVWQYIGGDYLQATAEATGKNPDRITIGRAEVMEAALDAGRPEDELRKMKRPELAEKLNQTPYAVLLKLVKPGFPHARYGM